MVVSWAWRWFVPLVLLGLCYPTMAQMHIGPNGIGSVPPDCTGSMCTSMAPCASSGIELTAPCTLIISGTWNAPVVIMSNSEVEIQGDGPVTSLHLNISTPNANAFVSDISMAESSLTIDANQIHIRDSQFNFDGVNDPLSFYAASSVLIYHCSITKNGIGARLIAFPLSTIFRIEESTVVAPNIFFSDQSAQNVFIIRSSINSLLLFSEIESSLDIMNSSLSGLSTGLIFDTAGTHPPPTNVKFIGSSIIGLSNDPILLFDTRSSHTIVSFEVVDSFLQDVIVPKFLVVNSALRIDNATMVNVEIKFNISAITNCQIVDSHFFWSNSSVFPLFLGRISTAAVEATIRNNTYEYTGSEFTPHRGSIFLGNIGISDSSDVDTDTIYIEGTITWKGNLTLHRAIKGTTAIFAGPLGNLNIESGSSSIVTFDSIDIVGGIVFGEELTYVVTNATIGIRPLGPVFPSIENAPTTLNILWNDDSVTPYANSTWPIFKMRSLGSIPTSTHFPDIFTYTFFLSEDDCELTACQLSFLIDHVRCPSNCNLTNTRNPTCMYPDICDCLDGWYGPTCDSVVTPSFPSAETPNNDPYQPPSNTPSHSLPSTCHSTPPGPDFSCLNGQWVSSTPVQEETFQIPPNSGPIIIEGNLNVSQTIIFDGLGSEIIVTGCIVIEGEVVIELTEMELEELQGGGKTKTLISSTSSDPCSNSTDLSLVHVVAHSPKECVQVSSENSGTRQSLSVLFKVDDSGCKKKSSNLVAIVVPSVIGAVIVLAAIGTLIGWKIRYDMMHKSH